MAQYVFPDMASNKGLTKKKTIVCLVGGIPTPLKSMKVNWDDDIPNIWKNNPNVPKPPLCTALCIALSWVGKTVH